MRLKIACVLAALLASSATPALAAKRVKGSERSERIVTTAVTMPPVATSIQAPSSSGLPSVAAKRVRGGDRSGRVVTAPSVAPSTQVPSSSGLPSIGGGPATGGAPDCSVVSFNVGTLSCAGFYSGNLITEGGPKLTEAIGITGGLDPSAGSLIQKIEWGKGMNESLIDFDGTFSGQVLIGIHFGGGRRGYNGTGFWLLDVPEELDAIRWTSRIQGGISNAGLYLIGDVTEIPAPQATPVPEPATWAMMLLGFGGVGFALRRRKGHLIRHALA
jgi:hypothetical protein